jgi:hypothetical protein
MRRVSERARLLGVAAVCAAVSLGGSALALADTPPPTDTTTGTATDTTATTTTAATTATTAATTTAAPVTTSAPPTTAPSSTPAPPRPTTTRRSTASHTRTIPCIGAGPLLLLVPRHPPRSVGSVSARTPAGVGATALRYPDDGSILRVAAVRADVSGCPRGTHPGSATTSLRSLSLFGGEVRAKRLAVTLIPGKTPSPTWRLRLKLTGLVVDNRQVTMHGGASVPVGNWARLKLDGRHARLGAHVGSAGIAWWQGGLSLRLTRPHAGLPRGTQILVAYVGADRPFAPRPHVPPGGVPLTVTPALLGGPYVFPVAGAVSFGDSYGSMRSDVPGGWHHGDDLFSALGSPVLAVAAGKVYSVGWNRVGGWRLWLKDRQGNRFYYAHLSGYTKYAKNGTHVKAGTQLAFIGNTGDAFTTPHHLHFEIHPVKLLHMGYAGAVDPTTYLDHWRHVEHLTVLAPVGLPAGAASHGEGAVSDYRQLLAVRGIHPAHAAAEIAPIANRPLPAAVAVAAGTSGRSPAAVVAAILVALAGVAGLAVWVRRRTAELEEPEP